MAAAQSSLAQGRTDRGAGARQPRPGAAEPGAAAGAVEGRADRRRSRSNAPRTTWPCARPTCRRASRTSRRASSRSSRSRPASRRRSYNLNQVIISSPMDGLVTRRGIEEGETAVVGTMNNAGTVLLTDRRHVAARGRSRGGRDRHPERDARPGRPRSRSTPCPTATFKGHVTEIGNSPIQQATTQTTGQRQATTFKVVVTLDEEVPDVRPASPAPPRSRRPRARTWWRCPSRR